MLIALGQAASAVEHSAIVPESKGTFRGRPTVAAVRVGQAPDIDGHLDDDAWRLAKPAGEFLQKSPNENIPHSQRTEFRVVYNDDALYVGVWCFDTEPGRIIRSDLTWPDGDAWKQGASDDGADDVRQPRDLTPRYQHEADWQLAEAAAGD